ncbi:pol polyprotein [Tanacetum coccineum]
MYVGKGYAFNGMFNLNVKVVINEINKMNSSAYLIESSNVWHGRLGHVNFNSMRRLIKFNSIPNFHIDSKYKCETCVEAKLTRSSLKSVKRKTKPLDMIHTDICDLKSLPTKGGNKYFITFIDDCTKYCYVYLLKSKDEAIDKFVLYKTEVENQLGRKIKVVRSDRGGEYVSPFTKICAKHGNRHEFTTPYSPQQNGIAERKNCFDDDDDVLGVLAWIQGLPGAVSLLSGYCGGRGRIWLYFTSLLPRFGGIGFVVAVLSTLDTLFLRLLAQDSGDVSEETSYQELALSNAVDTMVASIEITPQDYMSSKEKQRAYADELQEKLATNEAKPGPETENIKNELDKNCKNEDIKIEQARKRLQKDDHKHEDEKNCKSSDTNEDKKECKNEELKNEHEKDSKTENFGNKERNCKSPDTSEVPVASNSDVEEKVNEEVKMLSYGRKVTVLYQLLSACLADIPEDNSKSNKRAKGYDAQHRAALREVLFLQEAIEIIVACSAMAILKQEEAKQEEQEPKSKWTKWKRGGIIGAAAITSGTLMAITGGLAAPTIADGFSALAPTLGTIIPVIGAGGFSAVATAAGSVAGSVAVTASFGAAGAGLTGTKMARRTGSVDEFEFKAIGENHNQGVSSFFSSVYCKETLL